MDTKEVRIIGGTEDPVLDKIDHIIVLREIAAGSSHGVAADVYAAMAKLAGELVEACTKRGLDAQLLKQSIFDMPAQASSAASHFQDRTVLVDDGGPFIMVDGLAHRAWAPSVLEAGSTIKVDLFSRRLTDLVSTVMAQLPGGQLVKLEHAPQADRTVLYRAFIERRYSHLSESGVALDHRGHRFVPLSGKTKHVAGEDVTVVPNKHDRLQIMVRPEYSASEPGSWWEQWVLDPACRGAGQLFEEAGFIGTYPLRHGDGFYVAHGGKALMPMASKLDERTKTVLVRDSKSVDGAVEVRWDCYVEHWSREVVK